MYETTLAYVGGLAGFVVFVVVGGWSWREYRNCGRQMLVLVE